MKYIQQNIKAVILGLIVSVGVSYAIAANFTGPACAPPACNTDAPINTGTSSQAKMGSLGVFSSAAPAFSVPNGVSLFKDAAVYNLSILTTGQNNVGGIVFYPRNEDSLLSTNKMQIYSPSKGALAVWDNIIQKDVLKLNNGDVELTGKIRIAGGSPGAGKVLKSDSLGNATWENVYDTPSETPSTGIIRFYSRYYTLMTDNEFRAWFLAQPNGPATIMPEGTGSRNDRNWGNTRATANKLCQFFTNGGVSSFTQTGTGSNNNNNWLYWDIVQLKWRWNYSSWNNSVDIDTVNCITTQGIVRGGKYAVLATENIPYSSGNITSTSDRY